MTVLCLFTLLPAVSESITFPKSLLMVLLNTYIFVYLVGGKWSLAVVFISIREPEYLLSGLAIQEVPSYSIWVVPKMPGDNRFVHHCSLLSLQEKYKNGVTGHRQVPPT